jgi:hypothetical protein
MTVQEISDSGHGWLKVRLGYVYGLDISGYSYMDNQFAYLEEDCDAQVFYKKYPRETLTFAEEVYIDGYSKIRNKACFKQ